jgi:hypothetical protein
MDCKARAQDRAMAKLVPFPPQRPQLPRRLVKDGWWLVASPIEKAGIVVAFPDRWAPADETPSVPRKTACIP